MRVSRPARPGCSPREQQHAQRAAASSTHAAGQARARAPRGGLPPATPVLCAAAASAEQQQHRRGPLAHLRRLPSPHARRPGPCHVIVCSPPRVRAAAPRPAPADTRIDAPRARPRARPPARWRQERGVCRRPHRSLRRSGASGTNFSFSQNDMSRRKIADRRAGPFDGPAGRREKSSRAGEGSLTRIRVVRGF